MAVNKVVMNTENGTQTLIDLTNDSVTSETLAEGVTAHDASGNGIVGRMKGIDELLETTIVNDTLFWDGNTEGKTVFDMTGDGSYTYYPVSENVLSLDDLANGLILESSDINGNGSEIIKLTDFAKMTNNVIASRSVSSVLFVLADNTSLYGSTIPKKGVYFMSSEAFGVYVSSIQIEGYTGFNSEKKVFKKKYIPSHSHGWGDLTDDVKSEITALIVEELVKQGLIKTSTYTNVIKTSVGSDGTIFNGGKGWADNSRIGSGGIYLGNGTSYVTGYIEIDPNIDNVIRLKNITFDSTTNNNYANAVCFFDSSFARTNYDGSVNVMYSDSMPGADAVTDSNKNITQFTLYASKITNKNVKYFAISCGGISDDSIITINEPIE